MLTTTITQVQLAGNGVKLAFDFSIKLQAASDLKVYKIDAAGAQSALLVNGTDYTITFDSTAQTGTVTFATAPVSGGYALFQRVSDNTQQSVYPREGVTPAKTTETALDKLTALVQELQTSVLNLSLSQYSNVVQQGTFASLDAAANTTIFIAKATDTRQILMFLGSRSLGDNGWAVLGGF